MCMSRLHRIVACDGEETAIVEDLDGHKERVSLLAIDGQAPPRENG